jgi:hypothetical protein
VSRPDTVRQEAPAQHGAGAGLFKVWAALSVAAALLSMMGSVVGLLAPVSVYGKETPTLADAATAQDLVGLVIVGPLLIVFAVLATRGSLRCWLCWLGMLSFTVYNYAIYAFSINFGPLFLVWVAVLGLALYALIGGLTTLGASPVHGRLPAGSIRLTGWFLIVTATLFVVLWLSEIVPDLVAGRPSTSAETWNVPSNPVHVLDLAFFLPAVFVSGVLVLRRHWFGYATAPGQLTFLELTCLPILVTPIVANVRGHEAGWSVLVPIGVIATATLVMLARFLRGEAPGTIAPRGPARQAAE